MTLYTIRIEPSDFSSEFVGNYSELQ